MTSFEPVAAEHDPLPIGNADVHQLVLDRVQLLLIEGGITDYGAAERTVTPHVVDIKPVLSEATSLDNDRVHEWVRLTVSTADASRPTHSTHLQTSII